MYKTLPMLICSFQICIRPKEFLSDKMLSLLGAFHGDNSVITVSFLVICHVQLSAIHVTDDCLGCVSLYVCWAFPFLFAFAI